MTDCVQPSLIVEAGGFHDENVPFPAADGISQPGRIGIPRQLPAIGEDLAIGPTGLVENRAQPLRAGDTHEEQDDCNPHTKYCTGCYKVRESDGRRQAQTQQQPYLEEQTWLFHLRARPRPRAFRLSPGLECRDEGWRSVSAR